MGIEIERKFLVDKKKWKSADKGESHTIRQGYILKDPGKTVRVRIYDNNGFLTIKGKSTRASRPEFEYPIPQKDAEELLNNFCTSHVDKIRHKIKFNDKTWEVDEFLGDNSGLIIAEIELSGETETFDLPDWIGQEVTGEKKYYNSNLSQYPFKHW